MTQTQTLGTPRRAAPPAPLRLGTSAALALLCLCAACGDLPTVVEVTVTGAPEDTVRLLADVSIDDVPAKAPALFDQGFDRLSIQLPAGRKGRLVLDVEALGAPTAAMPEGCLRAEGTASLTLSGQASATLLVPLTETTDCSPWGLVPAPSSPPTELTAVAVSGPGEAVIGDANGRVYRLKSQAFRLDIDSNGPAVTALAVSGGGYFAARRPIGMAMGNGTLVFRQESVTPKAVFSDGLVFGLSAIANTVVAVGDKGVSLWDPAVLGSGNLGLMFTVDKGSPLMAVQVLSTPKIVAVAVGAGGIILRSKEDLVRFEGQKPEVSDTKSNLLGVFAASAQEMWAVGEGGAAVRWNGTSWASDATAAKLAGGATLRGVWGAGATAVWAVGDGGVILRWDGAKWQRELSPTKENLLAISGYAGAGGTDVYIVGAKGTVLHRAQQ